MTREAVNEQILALAAQGVPLKAIARTTGLSRQTIRKIVRGRRHDIFRTRQTPGSRSRQNGPADGASARNSGEGCARRASPARCASSANGLPVAAEMTGSVNPPDRR